MKSGRQAPKTVFGFLNGLPRNIAVDIANDLRYRVGDKLEMEWLAHEATVRIRNVNSNRYYQPRPDEFRYLQDAYENYNGPEHDLFREGEGRMVTYDDKRNTFYDEKPEYEPVYFDADFGYDDRTEVGAFTAALTQLTENPTFAQRLAEYSRQATGPSLSEALQQMEPPPTPVSSDAEQTTDEDKGVILVIAGNKEEAVEFATGVMGWKDHEWVYVAAYITMHTYKQASVYIVGTARERKDFGAIEGLFLMNGHTVLDTND